MELVEVGRNAPCPCGSGKKYKKCCLTARDAAMAGSEDDIDAAALVDRAIETDDWSAIHSLVDVAMEVFEAGAPLEHVRFRDDSFDPHGEPRVEPARLCTAGWLVMCERELAYVLTRYELEPAVRDGLRIAAHLVRRFGARSPIVDELVALQGDEIEARRQRIIDAMATRGIAQGDVTAAGDELCGWVELERPAMLSFAQWLALYVTPAAALDAVWTRVARHVCGTCLDELDVAPPELGARWIALAAATLRHGTASVGAYLARETPIRAPTDDERRAHDALTGRPCFEGDAERALQDIVRAAERRGDFADAALLRETLRLVQHWMRDRPRR